MKDLLGLEGLGFEAADNNEITAVGEFMKLGNPGRAHP